MESSRDADSGGHPVPRSRRNWQAQRERLDARHHATLRAAARALGRLRWDAPAGASALGWITAAWATYLPAYEELAARTDPPSPALRELLGLQDRLADLAELTHEDIAAASVLVDAVGDVGGPPVPDHPTSWPAEHVGRHSGSASMVTEPSQRVVPHLLPWLPRVPLVNAEPVDLYVWTPQPPEEDGWDGLLTADMFLLGWFDVDEAAAAHHDGYLMRLTAPAGSVVNVREVDAGISTDRGVGTRRPAWRWGRGSTAGIERPPDPLPRAVLAASRMGRLALLPVNWLPGVRLSGGYQLGADGPQPYEDVEQVAATVSFAMARHGVPGLPDEVVAWPSGNRQRDGWLVVPRNPPVPRPSGRRGWLEMHRQPLRVADGFLLLRVGVAAGLAIDVPATLERLSGVPTGRSLRAFTGVDLIVPHRHCDRVRIDEVYAPGRRRRRLPGHPLAGKPVTRML